MFEKFARVAAVTPEIRVADCNYNAAQIISLIKDAGEKNVHFVCLPELCISGYTCGDLFLQDALLDGAKKALARIVSECSGLNVLAAVGLPLSHNGKLFNVAAVFCRGKILGFVPKTYLPNYGEFYERRHFTPAYSDTVLINFGGSNIPFGTKIIFQCEDLREFNLAIEICEDLWIPNPPGAAHAAAGATVIANLSASTETIGKAAFRRSLVTGQSARLLCAYVYADAGRGESSTDVVFSGHNLVCENGLIFAESRPFGKGRALSEIDLAALAHDRRKLNTFEVSNADYLFVPFSLDIRCDTLCRTIDPAPFIPKDENEKAARCEDILDIQAAGLAKRLEHTGCRAVLGISGGLDSCLALITTVRAYNLLKIPAVDILAVTMPCFGTTERTKNNAAALCDALGIPCREIDISDSARQHLRDIGQEEENTVYENAQARIRTLVLMDLANQSNGLVVGSGDLSELALGWTTYNGDHMSMYGVNAGIPKTLVRHIVKHIADTCENGKLKSVLVDILDTPISPELLPPHNGKISQCTEDIVGPYELHDFFLYHHLRWGRKPQMIFKLACNAFKYPPDEINKWLKIFYTRFFSQQFKRNCLPDGPKIGSVALSPRGDWRMPSDAMCDVWMDDI